jgi:hypothetical protein
MMELLLATMAEQFAGLDAISSVASAATTAPF